MLVLRRKPLPLTDSKRLPQETEAALIAEAKSGSALAFERLAESYKRVLEYHINRLNPPPDLYDDLFQEGLIGLLKAVRSYDGKTSSFATFASLCVRNSIISGIRKLSKQALPAGSVPDNADNTETVPSAEEIYIDDIRLRQLYDVVFDSLSPFERTVFDMYLADVPIESIAFALGRESKSISNALCRIRTKLKRIIAAPDTATNHEKTRKGK